MIEKWKLKQYPARYSYIFQVIFIWNLLSRNEWDKCVLYRRIYFIDIQLCFQFCFLNTIRHLRKTIFKVKKNMWQLIQVRMSTQVIVVPTGYCSYVSQQENAFKSLRFSFLIIHLIFTAEQNITMQPDF